MNKLLCGIAILSVTIFSSCQKAYSPEGVVLPAARTTPPPILVKTISTRGADTSHTVYTYDAANRLINITIGNSKGENTPVTYYKITRDNLGRMGKVVTNNLGNNYGLAGIKDSLITVPHFPGASLYPDYLNRYAFIGGNLIKDSVVFTSFFNLNVITKYDYVTKTNSDAAITRTDYTYDDNGNIIKEVVSNIINGIRSAFLTTTIQYDSKKRPLQLGIEAFIINTEPDYVAKNNITRMIVTDNTGSQNFTTNYSYQYNSNNLPASAELGSNVAGGNYRFNYYYK
jgi:hypothetical protein